MARSESPPQHSSFWTTLPGIITAVAALMTATGGLIAVLRSGDGSPKQVPVTKSETAVEQQAAGGPGTCLNVLADVPANRRKILVDGARDITLIAPDEPKQGVVALELRSVDTPLAVVRFRFIAENEIFRIESIVNAGCAPISAFANASRGGDKHVLQNWDDLKLQLGQASYVLSLGYSAGEVDANYFHRIVE